METPASLWDKAVEFTSESGAPAGSRLKKLGVTMKPVIRAEREIPRRLDLVAPQLRSIFRSLVSGERPWPLYLWGQVGTGKTLAALCLCDHVEGSYYRTVSALATNRMARGDDMDHVGAVELAVLDEIGGRGAGGELIPGVVQDFADYRARQSHVAVYVSNLDVPQIAALFDDRIASRLSCGTVFELTGPDRRRERN